MTIEQLQYFCAICKYHTFSQAAIEMNITQSALSKQIAKLEQELDVLLFDRSHRQIVLTTSGQLLLQDIENIVQSHQNMMNHLATMKEKENNTIKIAMLPIFSQYDLSKKIKEFSKMYPHIHLQIDEIEERDIYYHFDDLHYHFYILRGDYEQLENYSRITLYKDSMISILSKNHPLSFKKKLSINDLKNENLLLPPKYTAISKLAIQACLNHGFTPIIKKHGRLETILSSACENEGIALVMKKSLHVFHLSDVKAIPLQENIQGDIYLYYSSKNQTNAMNQFIEFIK